MSFTYKKVVEEYVNLVLHRTGARPNPAVRMMLDIIFASATEQQCKEIVLLTGEFWEQLKPRLSSIAEQPKLELKL